MTVELNWPPEVMERLTSQAQQKGLSLEAYLLQHVLRQWADDAAASSADKRGRRAAAAQRILDMQRNVKPDPDGWTSRDYVNYGRR